MSLSTGNRPRRTSTRRTTTTLRQDDDFPTVARLVDFVSDVKPPFFRTNVPNLFAIYLASGDHITHDKKRGHDWQHFSVKSRQIYKHALKNAFQASAEKLEEFGMLERGLAEFPLSAVLKAKTLLETEQLYRSEKTLGVAIWLFNWHVALDGMRSVTVRNNLLWQAVAVAPPGYCHVKSTMIGTLLEDIASGMDWEEVKRRFAEKMHPLQYQRATAAPSEANIAQAEAIVAKLNSAGALDRRFARLEDIHALWMPKSWDAHVPPEGVFGHLKAKKVVAETVGSAVKMTWDKFSRMVLPTAEKIEMSVPNHGHFIALVTAANPESPPILQWDREDQRNRVSWYMYTSGSYCTGWNLSMGWTDVMAVTKLPPTWYDDKVKHHGEGVILILKGARDINHKKGGGLFTESLRSEYHEVRRTLEAHVLQASIANKDEATACGYDLRKGQDWNVTVRVTCNGLRALYTLDRWD